jgi:hypothetical protein
MAGIVEIGHAGRAPPIGPECGLPPPLFDVVSETFRVAEPLLDSLHEIAQVVVGRAVTHVSDFLMEQIPIRTEWMPWRGPRPKISNRNA